MADRLPNAPLTEAIFEMQWQDSSREVEQGTQPKQIRVGPSPIQQNVVDSYHKLFLNRAMERFILNYPKMQPLQTSNLPDEVAAHMVQYQFWTAPNEWPVIQIGPGIITVNDTRNYTWTDFSHRVEDTINIFHEIHPSLKSIRISQLALKYTNIIPFEFLDNDTTEFLRDMMHIEVSFPPELFQDGSVAPSASVFGLNSSFKTTSPSGIGMVSIRTGADSEGVHGLVWENQIFSSGTDVPEDAIGIAEWKNSAHLLAEHYFRSLSYGDLERRFRSE